jgi:predicted GH43/DUF377 family glycosyl hydrolase
MHRIWFNPSIVPPTDGIVYLIRFIEFEYNYYRATWSDIDQAFISPVNNAFYYLPVVSRCSEKDF